MERLQWLVSRRAWADVVALANQLLRGPSSHWAPVYAALVAQAAPTATTPLAPTAAAAATTTTTHHHHHSHGGSSGGGGVVADHDSSNNSNKNRDPTTLSSSSLLLPLESQQAEVMEICMLLAHALLKMRRYAELKLEVERWTFAHRYYYNNHYYYYNDYNNNQGTHAVRGGENDPDDAVVPWSLHILVASALQYIGNTTIATTNNNNNNTNSTSSPHDSRPHEPTNTGNSNNNAAATATDALHRLRADLPQSAYRYHLAVEQALANVYLRREEWRMALLCYQRMLELLPPAVTQEMNHTSPEDHQSSVATTTTTMLVAAYRCELFSRQGRVLLQVGALEQAGTIFQQAQAQCQVMQQQLQLQPPSPPPTDQQGATSLHKHIAIMHAPAQVLVNDGLLSFAYQKYEAALEFFHKAVTLMRKTVILTQPTPYHMADWVLTGTATRTMAVVGMELVSMDSLHALYGETMNNMSLCAVYTCRLQEAIHLLECLIREDPTSFMTERVTLNLWYVCSYVASLVVEQSIIPSLVGCWEDEEMREQVMAANFFLFSNLNAVLPSTLYELRSDTAVAARKKRVLQLIAKRFFLHDIGPESFRLG